MSRNKVENERKVKSISDDLSHYEELNSVHRLTRRNLKSPRLNGNSIIESTQKLAEMDIIKTNRIISRHSS